MTDRATRIESDLTLRERNWLGDHGMAQIEAKFDRMRATLEWMQKTIHRSERDDAKMGYPLPGDSCLAVALTTIDEELDRGYGIKRIEL